MKNNANLLLYNRYKYQKDIGTTFEPYKAYKNI